MRQKTLHLAMITDPREDWNARAAAAATTTTAAHSSSTSSFAFFRLF
jgi:hypothetical protein